MTRSCRCEPGRACPLCPGISDINLFRYRKRIIDLDAEVSDGAFDFGVAEQKLYRPQVAGSTVDQRRLCSPQRMRAKELLIETHTSNPSRKEPCVLPCGHATAEATSAGD